MKDSFASVKTDEKNQKWQQCIKRENTLYNRGNDIRSEFEREHIAA